MFGAANQLLGMLALCIATTVLIKMNKISYLWVTVFPMIFVGVITLAGCYELFVLFMSRAASEESGQALTMGINATLVGLVALLAIVVLVDSARKWYGYLVRNHPLNSTEVFEGEGINLPAGPCC
jgi:carbon starvation protein